MAIAFVVLVCLAAVVIVEVAYRLLLRLGHRYPRIVSPTRRAHRPTVSFALALTLDVTLRHTDLTDGWRHPAIHTLDILSIAAGAWLSATLLFAVEDVALSRFRTDVQDNRQARTVHTQIQILRRVTVVVVIVVAFAAIMLTFHEARIIGTSLLASAGVAAAIAAFASQALLSNVIAGLQLAFGESLRLGDVVVIDGEWGRVEEITLTYVAVQVWDDRRLIMPTSYFTNNPFENWTRTQAALLGAVELDVDWRVPVEDMRETLRAVLTDNPLWDGRVSVFQITDAVGGLVRVRALVSARDAPSLWDLRCLVRERLICWLRDYHPQALPHWRSEVAGEPGPAYGVAPPPGTPVVDPDSRMFGGDPAKRRRGRTFHGPQEPR